jgi:Ca2+-binding EF-hand superfamily protein
MERKLRLSAAAAFIVCFLCAPAQSQTGVDWVRIHIVQGATEGATWRRVQQFMMRYFYDSDPEFEGVSKKSYDQVAAIQLARCRALRLGQSLGRDMNGDGVVTREELEIALGPQVRQMLQGLVEPTRDQFLAARDKLVEKALAEAGSQDGKITSEQMVKAAEGSCKSNLREDMLVPLDLAADGGGVVTQAAYEAAVRRVFDEIDTDHDGILSGAELEIAKKNLAEQAASKQRDEQIAALRKTCGLPAVDSASEVAVVSIYQGSALSSVAIGDESAAVGVADVDVEDGDKPIYLVLASYQPTIWRISGATGRISALVLSAIESPLPQTARVGEIGVPREKVYIVPGQKCPQTLWQERSPESNARAASMVGHVLDISVGVQQISEVSIPSGKWEKDQAMRDAVPPPADSMAAAVWRTMLRFNPSGVVRLNAEQIVSAAPPTPYAVLPQEAGIARLVEDGSLRPIGSSLVVSTKSSGPGVEIRSEPAAYLITRQIRFPAGLYGGYAVNFLLPRSVPVPEGDPGHSHVDWDDTREPVFAKPTKP